jgi:glycosyltransferase involved in cell wall biosynthesis
MTTRREINAFVLLGHGFGASNWAARYAKRMIPGINEALPYGYYLAADDIWRVRYSEDAAETDGVKLVRRALRNALGFDLIHVIRNRRQLYEADVVWTFTEFEHLAALALLRSRASGRRPLVLANCVWLFDRWAQLSRARRTMVGELLGGADIVTCLCETQMETAKAMLPQIRGRTTLFGIRFSEIASRKTRAVCGPIRILAIGNDMHRDWRTLVRAVRDCENVELKIASHSKAAPEPSPNISVTRATSEREVLDLYDWADLVAIILKPNLHASGITAALEAVVRSVPVIATDTPGLRDYFNDGELHYVPVGGHDALREAVQTLGHDANRRYGMTAASLQRSLASDYTSKGFALRCKSASNVLIDRL